MPSSDQACVLVAVSIERASCSGGRSRCDAACGWQKYDSHIVQFHRDRTPTVSGPRETARASRLTADDRRRSAALPLGTLTPQFAQNNSRNGKLGFHRVNFVFAVFSIEHSLMHPGVRSSKSGRCAMMTDPTIKGDLCADRLARKPQFPQRNRAASPTTRTPFSRPTASRRAFART